MALRAYMSIARSKSGWTTGHTYCRVGLALQTGPGLVGRSAPSAAA